MSQNQPIESISNARYALKHWESHSTSSEDVKDRLLDFLDLIEQENTRLLQRCDAISAEQQQIEMALCNTRDAIVITTPDGTIRLVNPAFERLTGYWGNEIIGENHDRFWGYRSLPSVGAMKSVIYEGNDWQGELVLVSKTRQEFDVEVSVVANIHHTGEITHFVYTLHDITGRKKLEKDLNRQTQFLEKVINLNPSAIIILDDSGDWLLDNLAAKTLLSDLGRDSMGDLSTRILETIQSHKRDEAGVLQLNLSGGRKMTYMVFSEEIPARYLISGAEEKNLYLITLSDITANEQQNREILIRQKSLLASRIEKNMIQGEFIRGFIYHLQKPINISKAVISRVLKAAEQQQFDQLQQSVSLLNVELEYLEKVIAKFGSIPKQDVADTETTESNELADAIKILYRESYDSSIIQLSNDFESPVVYPFPYEIMQLMLKILIDNALESVESSGSKGNIRVEFSKNQGGVMLNVEDDGIGISKSEWYRIFEPFYTTKKDHSGLSLTILHQLLNNANGNIELMESDLGGARLCLFFPTDAK